MLLSLRLENFRNLENLKLRFDERNIILGDNGAGKTSVIEAIRLLSTGKSFRSNRLDDAVYFHKDFFRLQAKVRLEKEETLEFFYGRSSQESLDSTRMVRFRNKEIGPLDLLGVLPTVVFTADDLGIVLGPPQNRRRWLDGMVIQVDREFTAAVLQLARILRERSSLLYLVRTHRASPNELQPWDELLQTATETIRNGRMKATTSLTESLTKMGEKAIKLTYHYNEIDFPSMREQEIRSSQNLVGAHRDELIIGYKDHPARQFTSRGQARLITGLLKIAETEFFRSYEKLPILLLDDIVSELDDSNMAAIFGKIRPDTQIMVSAVKAPDNFSSWKQIILNA